MQDAPPLTLGQVSDPTKSRKMMAPSRGMKSNVDLLPGDGVR